jgi:heme exporter protein C
MLRALRITFNVSLALAAIIVAAANYLIFMVVPNERVMGAIQRIFYFHVPSAVGCYLAVAVLLIAALAYLAVRNDAFDAVGEAAGEVGFLFCTITLASGMIWAHVAWNTWFRFEPRLASFLLLWLLFLGYMLLRRFGDRERMGAHAAVLAVLMAVSVPVVVYSINLLPASAQLHPKIIAERGLQHPAYVWALCVSMLGVAALVTALIALRARIGMEERMQRVIQ